MKLPEKKKGEDDCRNKAGPYFAKPEPYPQGHSDSQMTHQPQLHQYKEAWTPSTPNKQKHTYLKRNSAACSFGYQSGRLSFTLKRSPR